MGASDIRVGYFIRKSGNQEVWLCFSGNAIRSFPTLPAFLSSRFNLVPVTLGNIMAGIEVFVLHPNRIRQLVQLYRKYDSCDIQYCSFNGYSMT